MNILFVDVGKFGLDQILGVVFRNVDAGDPVGG
jgi:hypothetical protein